jgi:MFS family permease
VFAGLVLSLTGFRGSFGIMAITLVLAAGTAWTLTSGTGRRLDARAKEKRQPWRPWVLLLYISVGLRQLANAGTLSLIYAFMAKLLIPNAQMGLLSAISPAVQVGMMLVIGRLSDRMSRRWVFLCGSALSVLTPLVFAVSSGASGLAVGYAFLGIAFPAVFIGASVMLSEVAGAGTESTSQGLLDSSRAIGGFTGPLVAGLLVRWLDFRGMFLGMAVSALLGLVVAVISMVLASRGSRFGAPRV